MAAVGRCWWLVAARIFAEHRAKYSQVAEDSGVSMCFRPITECP